MLSSCFKAEYWLSGVDRPASLHLTFLVAGRFDHIEARRCGRTGDDSASEGLMFLAILGDSTGSRSPNLNAPWEWHLL
jgi:hypothetical protein